MIRLEAAGGNRVMTEKIASDRLPTVSVIIPMRNEKQHVARCLESVINQDYPKDLIEIIVVDGGSNDGSLKIVKEFMEEYSSIRLLGGPGVNCPAAMNVGINNAKGELIAKVDAHGYIASDYLRMSAKYLSKDGEIKCVGGPIMPVAETCVEKANALARSSIFGVGKGAYSMAEKSQFVETVQCGVYMRDVLEEVRLFDESLQFGEDEEFNWRIRKKGYKIFATPEVRFYYFVRNSFGKLFKQYYNYGVARAKVIQKHPDFFRVKHVIPTLFILALFSTGVLSVFTDLFSKPFLGIATTYLAASLAFSALISLREGWKYLGLLPISFAALHFGYGMGLAQGVTGLCSVKGSRKRRKSC